MKRALKQAKAYLDARLRFHTADYELRKADSEFIGHSFDYTTPLYRKIMKIKGMQQETEDGFNNVSAKPKKNTHGIHLCIFSSSSMLEDTSDLDSAGVKYQYNDIITITIKVVRARGYKRFNALIAEIRKVTNSYIKSKLKDKK